MMLRAQIANSGFRGSTMKVWTMVITPLGAGSSLHADISATPTASLAGEPRLKIGQPDIIRPSTPEIETAVQRLQ